MYLIEDNMRQESRRFVLPMVAFSFYAALSIIVLLIDTRETMQDIARISVVSVPLSIWIWLIWLSAIKYKLTVTSEKVTIRTLFRRHEIVLHDITAYTCKPDNTTEFFRFELFTKHKKFVVSTRYKEEIIKILEEAQACEKTN